jgi:hypothetical protein
MTNNPPRDRNLKQHSILRESEIMKKASEPNCDKKKKPNNTKRESVCAGIPEPRCHGAQGELTALGCSTGLCLNMVTYVPLITK